MDRTALEQELKKILVETLMLDNLSAADIDSEAPLFGSGGLDLDSVDALELGMALSKRYGIEIDSSKEEVRRAFFSIRTLADLVGRQAKTGAP
jgi:acyl carrier protein